MKTKALKNNGSDEFKTPKYAIEPLKKYLLKGIVDLTFTKSDYGIERMPIIWAPFDTEDSNYVKLLKEWGYEVIYSHIEDGRDFFNYEPDQYDYIISNPPFSIKTAILKRLYKLGKPFAMLLPITTLEGIERSKLYRKHNTEILIFDKRIDFIKNKSNYFNSCYICSEFLPKKLIFEKLNKNNE